MQERLRQAGHEIVEEDDADAVVINTCTVKGPTERKIRRHAERILVSGRKLILTGCLVEADRTLEKTYATASLLSPDWIDQIAEAVEERRVRHGKRALAKPLLPSMRIPEWRSIVQVAEGCDSACTFCSTKFARGSIRSVPEEAILQRIEEDVQQGVHEVWLTSQDMSAYGVEHGLPRLPRLLRRILRVQGSFWVRIGMGNPHNYLRVLDAMLRAYADGLDRLYHFAHIPSQSGSNMILKGMRRRYSREDYLTVVRALRERFPWLTLMDDIIVGFPGESDEDFEATLSLIREALPDMVNRSKYWPRPGTPAARLPQIPGEVVKQRSLRLKVVVEEVARERNKLWHGWHGRILLVEKGKAGTLVGRNFAYKPVVVRIPDLIAHGLLGEEEDASHLLGQWVRVEITDSATLYLTGRPIAADDPGLREHAFPHV